MSVVDPERALRLFQDHQVRLMRFLSRRVGCTEAVRDLCQEVFLRLSASEAFVQADSPGGYLFQTAKHVVQNHHRAPRTRAQALEALIVLHGEGVDSPSAEHAALAEETLEIIDAALRQLSPLCQRVFHLSRMECLTQAAIAEAPPGEGWGEGIKIIDESV